MASPILTPSNSLTLASTSGDGSSGAPQDRFLLFGSQWLSLQNYISQGLLLPINQGDFTTKYGTFSSKSTIDGCLEAMTNVQNLSSTFGDPSIIKKQLGSNPDYLTSTTPPSEIYGHIIWLANQIQNTANTFAFTFQSLQILLAQGTEAERAANLRMVLTGPGGLTSTAEEMKVKTQALITAMVSFESKFSDANNQILEYSGASSDIMKQTSEIIGQYTETIEQNQKAADKAIQQWRDYTIAAVSASVGIMILTAGMAWPVALGVGIGLGVAAENAKSSYNDLTALVKKETAEKQQKVLLQTDLTGLNSSVANVAPAMGEFKQSLNEILGVWTDISMNLNYIATNYTDAQLADLNWVMQTMKIMDAQTKWQNISDTTKQFTQGSLVDYNYSTSFGTPITTGDMAAA